MHPVSLHQVGKTYRLGAVDVPALSDITLDIHQGAFTVQRRSSPRSSWRSSATAPCATSRQCRAGSQP